MSGFSGGGSAAAGFQMLGGAVSDLFSAQGARAEASSYRKAALGADEAAAISEKSTALSELMAQRKIFKTIGGQQAQIAGAGFSEAGSALDLLRDSTQQGALTKQVIGIQGQLQTHGFQTQAEAYRGEAHAADIAASGATAGAGMKLLGGLMSFL